MALKLGCPTSVALDISVGSSIKPKNNSNVVMFSSLKNMDFLSVGLFHHQYRINPCNSLNSRTTASPPAAAAANRTEESDVSDESPDESRSAAGEAQSLEGMSRLLLGYLSSKLGYGKFLHQEDMNLSLKPGNPSDLEITPDGRRSSVQSQLDLLERLTSNSTVNLEGSWQSQVPSKKTIREQLSNLVSNDVDEATMPLGKRFKPDNFNSLTISQKRNIKRQDYLDKVAKRNDIPFFATIGLFIILPPIVILGVAVATGYVDLFP